MNAHWEWKMIFSFILETKTLCMRVCLLSHFSCVRLSVTLRIIAHQAPLSMGVSRQEYWSGLPFPSLGDIPNPGIKPRLLYCRWILSLRHQIFHFSFFLFPLYMFLPHCAICGLLVP